MGATLKYGEFEFGPQMHYSKGGACGYKEGGTVKKAMGGSCGGYKEGGTAKKASSSTMCKAKGGKVAPKMCKAEGGKVVEKATGEKYASKKAMMQHEKRESPREQRQEMMKGKIPVRKSVPVASQSPLIAMKKGGKCYADGGRVNAEIDKAIADGRAMPGAEARAAYARKMESNKARAIAEAQMRDNAARQARPQVQNMPSNANMTMAPSRNPAITDMNNPQAPQYRKGGKVAPSKKK
jgi:hypothetical protein